MPTFMMQEKKNPKIQLSALLGLLVVVVGLFLMLGQMLTRPAASTLPPPDKQKLEAANAENGSTADDPLPGIAGEAEFVDQHMSTLDKDNDDEVYRFTDLDFFGFGLQECFSWLKYRTPEQLAAAAYPRNVWNYQKIMRDTDKWRLKVMHVYGQMLFEEEVRFDNASLGMRKMYKITIHDDRQSVNYCVLTPLRPAGATGPKGRDAGTYLACDAVFAKRQAYLSKRGWQKVPLFCALRVYRASEADTPPDLLDERVDPGEPYRDIVPADTVDKLNLKFINDTVFAPAKDGGGISFLGGGDYLTEARNLKPEKAIYDHALQYVWHFSDQELAGMINPQIDYVTLMKGQQPPAWTRGEVVKFVGRAGKIERWPFPNDQGFKRMYILYANDSRLIESGLSWALLTLNLPEGLREEDMIETEGVFIKLYPFRTLENKWHWSPLLVCKSIRRVRPDQTQWYMVMLAGLAVVVMLGGILLLSRRDAAALDRLRRAAHERRLEKEKAKLQQRKSGAATYTPAAGDAPPAPEQPQPENGGASDAPGDKA